MSGRRIAVVTGSNKGIGYAIVRGLCKQFDGDVFLTECTEGNFMKFDKIGSPRGLVVHCTFSEGSDKKDCQAAILDFDNSTRNVDLGNKAVESLKGEGFNPKFHQLDITDRSSIENFRDFIKSNYGGLDILVNNAAIAYELTSTTPFAERAEVTCKTNFTGTLDACNILFPLLRPHARVCNVSSKACQDTFPKCRPDVQSKFKDGNLTMPQLEKYMQEFIDSAKTGDFEKKGYPETAYGMSKVGVTVMTLIQHREMSKDPREDIVINCCCPGYVDTDMTCHKGTKTIDEGADTPLYLAMLPPGTKSPNGEFLSNRQIQDWANEN